MKKRDRFLRIVAVTMCSVIVMITMSNIKTKASNIVISETDLTTSIIDEQKTELNNSDAIESSCGISSLYLRPIINTIKQFAHGSEIAQSYEVIGRNDGERIVIRLQPSEGIELLSESVVEVSDAGQLTVRYRLKSEFEEGQIDIEVEGHEEDAIRNGLQAGIFCVNAGSYDYMSLNNIEDAMYLAGIVRYDTDLPDVVTGLPFINNGTGISTLSTTTTTISGTVLWTDKHGDTHAAQNMKIEIYYYYGSSWYLVDTTTTNIEGYYSKSFSTPSGYTVKACIEVCSTGQNINVKSRGGSIYESQSTIITVTTGSSVNISYTFNNSSNAGKATSVYQAMQYASRGVKMLERSFLDTIDVYYPDSDGGLSYFSRSATIHIDADDAWYWDAMQHEYGHYVQYSLGIGITDLGLKHDDGENLAETHGKETATQLAWTEGWATYFALTLQDKLEIDKLRIPLVCDGVWTSSNGGTAIEHNHQRQGEFGEGAVAAVLYDLTDSANNGESTIDSLALDVRAVWDITVDNSCKTFSEFINAINGVYPNSTKLNMGNLLSFYKMAAVISDDSVSIGSTMATITWDDNSYSSTAKYPNNSFCVAFYDSNYELILKTSYTTEESQIITAAQCNAIINATGNTVYWCIETKQTDSPVTGPYNSNLGTINIP